jgi:hypothetical protein
MRFIKYFPFLIVVAVFAGTVGCTDVGVNPKDQISSESAFKDPQAIRGFLGKLYAGLSVSGQEGPAGDPDLQQIDEGFSQYTRLLWQMQELPTDEAVIAWNDGNVQELNTQTWSAENGFTSAMYARIFFQVAQVNEFLRQSTEAKLDEQGIRESIRPQIKQWRAEARFLRALSYWHAIDLFGAVPLVTEEDPIGTGEGDTAPGMSTTQELFSFVENELITITDSEGDETLAPAGQVGYGRADKAAAWMVLAKLYQNAPVYIGEQRSSDVVTYTSNIIDAYGASPNALEPEYHNLFLADNGAPDPAKGIIFPVPQDGQRSQSFGNTTYLVNAAIGGDMSKGDYGVTCQFCGWAGLRTTPEAVNLYSGADTRPEYPNIPGGGKFFTAGQSKQIETITSFSDGYAVPKYQNVTSGGQMGSDDEFPDTDFPMFRLADAYLMYAEAKLRGGAGGSYDQLRLVNLVRDRAGLSDIGSSQLDLQFILDERARELFWEAHRRTDLRRFEQFTGGDYVWSWKGDAQGGTSTEDFRGLYPLPSTEIQSNPNLTQDDQNPGY